MKPIVIILGQNTDKVDITKEQLEKYIQDAYEQGYTDACHNNVTLYRPNYSNDITTTISSYPSTCKKVE